MITAIPHDGVAHAMRSARTMQALNAVANLIQHVDGGADGQAPLHKIYKQRSDQLKGKA